MCVSRDGNVGSVKKTGRLLVFRPKKYLVDFLYFLLLCGKKNAQRQLKSKKMIVRNSRHWMGGLGSAAVQFQELIPGVWKKNCVFCSLISHRIGNLLMLE